MLKRRKLNVAIDNAEPVA
jgi:hypothetical protein